MSILAIGSDKHDVFRLGDEMSIRGWHIDRQQNPESLHLTISYGNVKAVDQFPLDLAASVEEVNKFSLREVGNKVALGLVKGIAAVLPEKQMSQLTQAAARLSSGNLPKRSAAMYGMMGILPNEGDVKEIVLNMLDGMNKPDKKD